AHLAGRLVGERDRKNLPRINALDVDQARDARGQYPSLTRPGTGEHEQGPVHVQYRFPLRWVEPGGERLVKHHRHHGRIISNVAPCAEDTSINFPPWFSSTIRFANARPMPHPVRFVEKPGSNTRDCN